MLCQLCEQGIPENVHVSEQPAPAAGGGEGEEQPLSVQVLPSTKLSSQPPVSQPQSQPTTSASQQQPTQPASQQPAQSQPPPVVVPKQGGEGEREWKKSRERGRDREKREEK